MDQNQTFSLTSGLYSGVIATFVQLVLLIILAYLLIAVLNFLRDKFINRNTDTTTAHIGDLVSILHKLFYFSGFGFIIANLVEFVFTHGFQQHRNTIMNLRGEWDHLTFGVILIFVGLGFKSAHKAVGTTKAS